ncbi:hypothetical protein CEXT_425661 [Caerostris extrusa]|uniref:Uncharacterized protein n=1 Tax=Caerostris extrusa TaxID=172846 RepID=A0AAV4XXX7_CAEEX|nr:hypothetical protein CEXT_425661 [Caerostris extrusa]
MKDPPSGNPSEAVALATESLDTWLLSSWIYHLWGLSTTTILISESLTPVVSNLHSFSRDCHVYHEAIKLREVQFNKFDNCKIIMLKSTSAD